MTQLDDLNSALSAATAATQKLITDVATEVANLNAQIAALQAQVAAGQPVDLTGAIASANALTTLVKGADPTP